MNYKTKRIISDKIFSIYEFIAKNILKVTPYSRVLARRYNIEPSDSWFNLFKSVRTQLIANNIKTDNCYEISIYPGIVKVKTGIFLKRK